MEMLNQIQETLINGLGEFGPLIVVGTIGAILIVVTIILMLNQRQDPIEKLKKANKTGRPDQDKKKRLRSGGHNQRLEKYASFLEPQDAKQLSKMKLTLMQAGYRHNDAVRYFHFSQFALGIICLFLGVVYFLLFVAGGNVTTSQTILYIMGPGLVGYIFPKYWVTKRLQKRQEEITDGFPDSLDMMLVCVEAGQSIDQAIVRVAKEIHASFPALAEEYEIVSHKVKAGRDKASVMREMSERCGIQDISSFVTVLIQSQTYGTPVADALRVYASEMRDKRVMRAEEKANKLPTKMTLATMMFTVPALLIILVGPSVLGVLKLFSMQVGAN